MSRQQGTDSIRISQVVAGALAAVTAALLGSTMGVAGTVVGAGVASVVSTVGGALYLRSIQRTGQGVRTVRERVVARAGSTTVTLAGKAPGGERDEVTREEPNGEPDDPADAEWRELARGGSREFAGGESGELAGDEPAGGESREAAGESNSKPDTAAGAESGAAADGASGPESGDGAGDREPSAKRLSWPAMIVGSVLAFVLGMAVITGVEWLRGEPLSGGEGTTVGDIVRVQPGGGGEREDTPPPETDQSSTPPSTGGSTVTVTPTPTPTSAEQAPTAPPSDSSTPETTLSTTTTDSAPTDASSVPPSGPTG